jgi:hypothetical protein
MCLSAPYQHIIDLLGECAKEKDIPLELIKKIYDLEKSTAHQNSRDNETALRIDIIKSLESN